IMFRTALNRVGGHSETTAMIGDRMDTDVVAGVEAGLNTFLVLTGITTRSEVETFPYRPDQVVNSIQDLIDIAESGVVEF
ncbi:MAG: HAD hydrolase-like protein, partial [Bifidobacteriales bacterium]|nr:HAD hydrolase-like protein [Bifidobacteriales bacterium]